MLPTERTRGAAAAAIQPSAPGSQQLFPDKEREVQRPAPAGTRGTPLSGEEGAGAGLYPLHLPIARGGQAGTALCAYLPPPSPAGLKAAAEAGFPRYYNNQPATARSDPLRRRPRPGAEDA